jgi:hypothetical protein
LPSDEFRALVDAERGSALLGFSANTQPDAFWLRVYGEKMQAVANLFETRLTIDRAAGGPKPLRALFSGLREARDLRRAALSGLNRKLSGGPGAYEGLWELLAQTYRALGAGSEPPITPRQIVEVNRLVDDLKNGFLGRHVVAEFLRRDTRCGLWSGQRPASMNWIGPVKSRSSGPTCGLRRIWPQRSQEWMFWCTWRPPSREVRTRSSPRPSSAPNGS